MSLKLEIYSDNLKLFFNSIDRNHAFSDIIYKEATDSLF